MDTAGDHLPGELPHEVIESAAQWYAELRSGNASEKQERDLAAWLAQNPSHGAAWSYVERISQRFEPIRGSESKREIGESYAKASKRQSRRRFLALPAIGAAVFGGLLWKREAVQGQILAMAADVRTRTGEIRELRLDEHSALWLNTATAANYALRSSESQIEMVAGEILVHAEPGHSRMFSVEAPHVRMTARGSRFGVLSSDEGSLISVYHGSVSLSFGTELGELTLKAGQQLRVLGDTVGSVVAAHPAREAWIHGMLVAQDDRFSDVVADLRRYRRGHLALSPDVADHRVVGTFPLNDTDKALEMMASVLPIAIHQRLPWWTSIEKA
nr:FecR domain-containing protein [Paracidovorax cattleyae]